MLSFFLKNVLNRIIQPIHHAALNMTQTEGNIKLLVTMAFVPLPIVAGALGGFWLDRYQFHTLPLFSITGTLAGTVAAFLGVCAIITYGHRGGTR